MVLPDDGAFDAFVVLYDVASLIDVVFCVFCVVFYVHFYDVSLDDAAFCVVCDVGVSLFDLVSPYCALFCGVPDASSLGVVVFCDVYDEGDSKVHFSFAFRVASCDGLSSAILRWPGVSDDVDVSSYDGKLAIETPFVWRVV